MEKINLLESVFCQKMSIFFWKEEEEFETDGWKFHSAKTSFLKGVLIFLTMLCYHRINAIMIINKSETLIGYLILTLGGSR